MQRAQKKIPYHYTIQANNEKKTAMQKFEEKHADLLTNAQKWIKETAQSCSAVAVLVATVVFAAAYTVPGGTDDKGLPRFLHNPVFLFFTIMDIASLASSLSSLVMFLSILTSPCELWDFRRSLPRKLMAGFGLLFLSLATTMLAFSATMLLNVQLKGQNWTATLTYGAAFFPVSIFAMMQFPLYLAVKSFLNFFSKKVKKLIPKKLRPQFEYKKGFIFRK